MDVWVLCPECLKLKACAAWRRKPPWLSELRRVGLAPGDSPKCSGTPGAESHFPGTSLPVVTCLSPRQSYACLNECETAGGCSNLLCFLRWYTFTGLIKVFLLLIHKTFRRPPSWMVAVCVCVCIYIYIAWYKKKESILYFYIYVTIHDMWTTYIIFERGGPKVSSTTARALT